MEEVLLELDKFVESQGEKVSIEDLKQLINRLKLQHKRDIDSAREIRYGIGYGANH